MLDTTDRLIHLDGSPSWPARAIAGTWNGFVVPRVTPDVRDQIAAWSDADDAELSIGGELRRLAVDADGLVTLRGFAFSEPAPLHTTTLDVEALKRALSALPFEYDPELKCRARRVYVGRHEPPAAGSDRAQAMEHAERLAALIEDRGLTAKAWSKGRSSVRVYLPGDQYLVINPDGSTSDYTDKGERVYDPAKLAPWQREAVAESRADLGGRTAGYLPALARLEERSRQLQPAPAAPRSPKAWDDMSPEEREEKIDEAQIAWAEGRGERLSRQQAATMLAKMYKRASPPSAINGARLISDRERADQDQPDEVTMAWLVAADQACTDAGLVLEDGADPCDAFVAEYAETVSVQCAFEPDGDAQRDARLDR